MRLLNGIGCIQIDDSEDIYKCTKIVFANLFELLHQIKGQNC